MYLSIHSGKISIFSFFPYSPCHHSQLYSPPNIKNGNGQQNNINNNKEKKNPRTTTTKGYDEDKTTTKRHRNISTHQRYFPLIPHTSFLLSLPQTTVFIYVYTYLEFIRDQTPMAILLYMLFT